MLCCKETGKHIGRDNGSKGKSWAEGVFHKGISRFFAHQTTLRQIKQSVRQHANNEVSPWSQGSTCDHCALHKGDTFLRASTRNP